jgi:3'-5' exoribonuclease
VVLGGLIHDAGKADDYRFDRIRQCFEMSGCGTLICHRDRVQHWIAAAMAQHRVIIPEAHFLGLVHALTAAKGAPAHLGLREPRSLEATILSMADRLSGEGEMFSRLAPAAGGFGKYHRHLKGRPFVARLETN